MMKDMTTGSPTKVIIYFAMPMLLGNIIQQLYTMIDAMVVGKYVGVNELAAVGATNSLNFFIISAIIGLTSGISVVISQYFGARDYEKVLQGISTAVIMIALASIVMSIIGIIFARPLLILLRTPTNILDDSTIFLKTLFIGILPLGLYNGVSAILRSFGNSIAPLVFLVISAITNIILDFVFILGFQWGVQGAAAATAISQLFSAVLCMGYAYKHIPYMRIKAKELKIYPSLLKEMFRIGLPSALQGSFISVGNMAVQSLINSFGSAVVAAYTAASRIDSITYQPGIAFGAASSMFAGQNIGAGKVDRVRKGLWSSLKFVSAVSIIITILVQLFAREFLLLFLDSSETNVLNIGESYLRVVSIFYLVVGVLFVVRETLRGTGDAMIPMGMGIFELVSRIIIGFVLSTFMGYMGIWWATPVAWVTATILGVWRYRSGIWQNKAVINHTVKGGDIQHV